MALFLFPLAFSTFSVVTVAPLEVANLIVRPETSGPIKQKSHGGEKTHGEQRSIPYWHSIILVGW